MAVATLINLLVNIIMLPVKAGRGLSNAAPA